MTAVVIPGREELLARGFKYARDWGASDTVVPMLAAFAQAEIARLAAKPADEQRPELLTNRELYDNSCITRHQLKNWVDSDYAAHVAGLKHTIEFLLARLDALSTTGEPKP